MTDQYSISALLGAFKMAYRTIDLGAALVNDEGQWRIVSIALRVKIAPQDLVVQHFERESKGRKIDSDKIKVIHHCMHFVEFDKLINEFSQAEFTLGGLKVPLNGQKDILAFSAGRISSEGCK